MQGSEEGFVEFASTAATILLRRAVLLTGDRTSPRT